MAPRNGRHPQNRDRLLNTVGGYRTAWHLLAAAFIDERRPSSVTLDSNFELTREPQRADLLLIRKSGGPVDDARAFRRLWALMGPQAIVEYKSRSRPARSGVMSQLLGYGHQYARDRREELGDVRNLDTLADEEGEPLIGQFGSRTLHQENNGSHQ